MTQSGYELSSDSKGRDHTYWATKPLSIILKTPLGHNHRFYTSVLLNIPFTSLFLPPHTDIPQSLKVKSNNAFSMKHSLIIQSSEVLKYFIHTV